MNTFVFFCRWYATQNLVVRLIKLTDLYASWYFSFPTTEYNPTTNGIFWIAKKEVQSTFSKKKHSSVDREIEAGFACTGWVKLVMLFCIICHGVIIYSVKNLAFLVDDEQVKLLLWGHICITESPKLVTWLVSLFDQWVVEHNSW